QRDAGEHRGGAQRERAGRRVAAPLGRGYAAARRGGRCQMRPAPPSLPSIPTAGPPLPGTRMGGARGAAQVRRRPQDFSPEPPPSSPESSSTFSPLGFSTYQPAPKAFEPCP